MNITITSIEHNILVAKQDGTQFTATRLGFTKDGETNVSHKIFPAAVLANNEDLALQLRELQVGQKVSMDYSKTQNAAGFRDVVGFSSPKPAFVPNGNRGNSSWQPKAKGFDEIGAQVGNALTTAARLISAGVPEFKDKDLESATNHVIAIGNRVRAKLEGAKTQPKSEPAPRTVAPAAVIEEVEY